MLNSVRNYIMIIFLCVTLNVFIVSGVSVGKEVNQDPSDVIKRLGEPAIFNCRHKISGYNRILWYKQLEDGQMEYLGYMNVNTGYPEDKDKVSITGNANENENCTLTIKEVDLNSSAVYFCAAIHSPLHLFQSPLTSVGLYFSSRSDTMMGGLETAASDFHSNFLSVVMETSEVQISCKHNDNNLELMLCCHRNSSSELVVLEPSCTAALSGSQRWRLRYGGAEKQTGTLQFSSELFDIKPERCADYEAYFGAGTKLTVLARALCQYEAYFSPGTKLTVLARALCQYEAYFSPGTKLTVLARALCQYEAYFSPGTKLTVLARALCQYEAYFSPGTKLTVLAQALCQYEAYFGPGTKLTTLYKHSYRLADLKDVFEVLACKERELEESLSRRINRDIRKSFCHGGKSLCSYTEAYFGAGTKLTVLDEDRNITEPKVTLFPPSKKECGGKTDQKKKTIVCVASEYYPDHIVFSWFLNDEEINGRMVINSSAVKEDETYSISSRLRVTAEEWHSPENNFTCKVSFWGEEGWLNQTASVNGEEDTAKKGVPTREKYLKVTQSAKLCYTVLIVKSCIYGGFVALLLLKLKGRKQKK
ncbi:uncharacterized protein LOC117806520 [Notolabrus celidotus]|uniref:uncharacterized protein LOC117806520 n=1 Tax=Notolabrus celidotus TaxID=1203425 RepID=UPI00148F8B38|nr:uncharacterized protein LOC117806520 [Notolabrus celidotus]